MRRTGLGFRKNLLAAFSGAQWSLLGAALLTVATIISYSMYTEYMLIDAMERDRLTTQARVVNENLERQLTETNNTLDSIRHDLPLLINKNDGGESLKHRLQIMRDAMTGTRAITLFNAYGTLIARSPDQFVGQNFAQRDYFQIARRGGDPVTLYLAPPFIAATGDYVLNVSKVVLDDHGEFAGVILASLGPSYFSTLLNSVNYAPDMQLGLVHGDGKTVFQIPAANDAVNKEAKSPINLRVLDHLAQQGQTRIFDAVPGGDGETRLTVLHTIQPEHLPMDKALVLTASRDRSIVFSFWRKDLAVRSVLFLLLVLATTTGLFFHRRRQQVYQRHVAEQEAIRQQAQAALRESEERWNFALEAGEEGVWDWNIQTGEAHYSRRWKEMLGFTESEIGSSFADWTARVHPEDLPLVMSAIQAHLDGKTASATVEMRLLCKDGQWKWTLGRGMLVGRDASGNPLRLVGTNVDITERRRIADELEQHREHLANLVADRTRELADRNASLETTMSRLQHMQRQLVQSEKLSGLGAMVAGVSHELNTPIGNARVVATSLGELAGEFATKIDSGLKRSDLDSFMRKVNEGHQLIERNLIRAAGLIQSFKQVAVDQTSSHRRRFDLQTSIEEILATVRPSYKTTPYRIVTDLTSDLTLDSYPGPLGQVIVNLLENARIHGFDGRNHGIVYVRTKQLDADYLLLTVEDDGIGIPAPHLPRIFDPFFTTRMSLGGSGLGLNIVYNIVTGLLGGSISVTSQPGQGAAFTLQIPCIAPSAPRTGSPSMGPATLPLMADI